MISVYSVVSAVVFYNVGMLLLYVLLRTKSFITQYTVSALIFTAVLSVLRLLLPLDFRFSYVISSTRVLPWLADALDSTPAAVHISVDTVLLGIWGAGTAWYIFKTARAELRAYRVRRKYTYTGSEQVERALADFPGKYRVRLSPNVSEPYTVGIVHPEILLPDMSYSDEELHFILAHEIQHIRSRDNLKKLFFVAAEALFWWNPLSHVYVNEYEMLTELECDRRVTEKMDSDTLKAYLGAILSVMKRLTEGGGERTAVASSFAQTYSVKRRFAVLLDRRERKSGLSRAAVYAVMFALFLASYLVIWQPRTQPPSMDQGMKFVINADNSFLLRDGDVYHLICNGYELETVTEDDLISAPLNELKIIN